jgi:hypothetical protein
MKRLIPILGLLLLSCPSWATWTLTQVKDNTACSGTTCAVTVTSTGSGHLLVAGIASNNSTAATISGVSAAACVSAWVHCTNCSLAVSGDGNVDFSYCLNSVSGQTSITISSGTSLGAGSNGFIWEASSSLGSIALDSGATPSGTKNNTTSATSQAGVSLTLSGNNDFIAAIAGCGSTCNGLTGTGWTNDLANPNGDGAAHGITNGSQTGPTTWTQTSSSTLIAAAIAFQESSGGAAPAGFNKRQKIERLEAGI